MSGSAPIAAAQHPGRLRPGRLLPCLPLLVSACAGTPAADRPPAPEPIPELAPVESEPRTMLVPEWVALPDPKTMREPACQDWGTRHFFGSASPEDVRECLQEGADPTGAPGLYPLPPLFVAAGETPHPEVIAVLVAAGADVDAREWGGLTPLHEAAAGNRRAGVVNALVEAGADPNAQDADGVAPLHLAASLNRSPEVATALVEAGADPNLAGPAGKTPLEMAWFDRSHGRWTDGRVAVMRELLRLGATGLTGEDLDRITDPTYCGYWHDAEFHRVAGRADFPRCLEEGADLAARDQEGNTVLHHAAATDAAVTSLLLDAGAEVDALNRSSRTPLHHAAGNADSATVSVLLDAGADADGKDRGGDAPLNLAVWQSYWAPATATRLARQLLAAGADPNRRGRYGDTPLYKAAEYGNAALAGALLEAGADPDALTLYGESAIEAANESGHTEVIRLLVAAGADVKGRGRADGVAPPRKAVAEEPAPAGERPELAADPTSRAADTIEDPSCEIRYWIHKAPLESVRDCLESVARVDGPVPSASLLDLAGSSRAIAAPRKIALLLAAGAHPHARDHGGETPLHVARTAGAAAALVAGGADVDARDSRGWTPLHTAASRAGNDTTVLMSLLRAGADPDARTHLGETPLHLAAMTSPYQRAWEARAHDIAALLGAGADLDARTSNGRTPLHMALRGDRPAAALRLLAAGADPGARDRAGNLADPTACDRWGTATFFAAAGVDAVARCIAGGANPNPGPRGELRGSPTLLHLASVHSRDPAVIAHLVRAGADLHARNKWGYTPLHEAAQYGTATGVRALLEAGADPQVRQREFLKYDRRGGWTPLHMAAQNPDPEVTALLLEAGALANAPASVRWDTPLHWAAGNPNPAVAMLLLRAGANVNARGAGGATPLHGAARNPNPEVLAVLLRAGADPDARGELSDWFHWDWSADRTPLYDAALHNRNPEIVAMLFAAGADVDARGTRVRLGSASAPPVRLSPLYMAVRNHGHPAMIEALARAGADLELTDREGRTVLHRAAVATPHVFPLLLRLGADPEALDAKGKTPMDYARENAALRPWKGVVWDSRPPGERTPPRRPSAPASQTVSLGPAPAARHRQECQLHWGLYTWVDGTAVSR